MIDPQPDWWIISDTHWLHRNINEYCWRTTPSFPTPESVDDLMYANWRGLVRPDDTVLHLGDLCFWDQGDPIPEIAALPGSKILLKGNHDIYNDSWYEDHGFKVLKEKEISSQYAHPSCGVFEIIFSHYPKPELPLNVANVHGHIHNNPSRSTSLHLNVSVETTHFAPVKLEKIIDKLAWQLSHGSNEGN